MGRDPFVGYEFNFVDWELQFKKNETEYNGVKYNTIENVRITANKAKYWFVKRCVSVACIHILMSVPSDDVECISPKDRDQNNAKF